MVLGGADETSIILPAVLLFFREKLPIRPEDLRDVGFLWVGMGHVTKRALPYFSFIFLTKTFRRVMVEDHQSWYILGWSKQYDRLPIVLQLARP
jgi:hypothetical protein